MRSADVILLHKLLEISLPAVGHTHTHTHTHTLYWTLLWSQTQMKILLLFSSHD